VQALHVYVDELDIKMAKLPLVTLYESQLSADHVFPLHVQMHLVLEINLVLNTKDQRNVDKLCTCQNIWNKTKLVYIKMWEIEPLDSQSRLSNMLMRDTMMMIRHPSNLKFALFHLVDKSWWEACHILIVLKSAKLYAHTMI